MAYYRDTLGWAIRQDAGGFTPRLGGEEVMTVTSTGRTVDQTSHRLVREALRETVRAGPGAGERVGMLPRVHGKSCVFLF